MAFPGALIAALAGLALLGAIANALHSSMSVMQEREAALITFLVTASGMSMFGLASAFWGLLFGIVAHLVMSWRRVA
jgi:benzoate membrane transport protein